VALLAVTLGQPALAQTVQPGDPPLAPADKASPAHCACFRNRLYVGMWTMHLKEPSGHIDNNWLLGVSHGPFYLGTFVNSFGRRAYTAGLQQTVARTGGPRLAASLGLREGVVSGYDGRFGAFAKKSPVLPLIQVFGLVEAGRAGIEVSYTVVIVSVALSYGF
jgi:hypothetical protein